VQNWALKRRFNYFEDNKMQLDEQLHQHIELLPLELKAEVLDFVLFLEQKQARERIKQVMSVIPEPVDSDDKKIEPKTQKLIGILKNADNFVMEEDNTQELLELITHITPVKCQYTTEQIVRNLRDGTELE
jgi:hypothetical protein